MSSTSTSATPAGSGPTATRRPAVRTRTGLRTLVADCLVLLVTLGLLASLGASHRQTVLQHAATRAEPLSVAAEDLYRDLSDADATAAEVFLSGSQAGTSERNRYDADLRRVSASLAAVNADADPSLAATAREILADLPVYTNLVSTALADSRQNLPIGAAYLREASALLRAKLLPAAQHVLQVETDRLAADDSAATAFPAAELAVLAVTLAALAGTHLFLARRTRRLHAGDDDLGFLPI